MLIKLNRNKARIRRHRRTFKRLRGTAELPRLCVFRSLKNIYVQVVDDDKSHTLLALNANSKESNLQESKNSTNKKSAAVFGKLVALQCLKNNIQKVVFDRNGYAYHGAVKALADAAREAGLRF
jgi:large subunit ribosomal protein L18